MLALLRRCVDAITAERVYPVVAVVVTWIVWTHEGYIASAVAITFWPARWDFLAEDHGLEKDASARVYTGTRGALNTAHT